MTRTWMKVMCYGAVLLMWPIAAGACGGGEEATPIPSPNATPLPTSQPAATATPQPAATATPQPAATATPQPAATATPRRTGPQGTLRVAMANFSTEDLDPITSSGATLSLIGAPMFDWAVWYTKAGQLAPGVFEQWKMAADGMSWTFTTRDMRFQNGQPITAEDVKFNIERVLTPESVGANSALWKSGIASVEATSARTGVIRLKEPWPIMPLYLAPTDGAQGALYPKADFLQAGQGAGYFRRNPIGSGPFKFAAYQAGTRLVYEASGQKHPYREQPEFQTLELLLVAEASTRVAMLRTGAADIVSLAPENTPSLQRDGFPLLRIPSTDYSFLHAYGLTNPDIKDYPIRDVKVREALSLAVNRQEIADALLGGFATVPVRGMMDEGTLGWDPSWKPLPYSPNRAKELLAEAGYSKGSPLKLYNPALPAASWSPRAGEAIAGYWAAIGVQTEIVPIDYAAYRTLFREHPAKALLGAYGWLYSGKSPNPMRQMSAHYVSTGAIQILNNPELDDAVSKANTTLDGNERVALIRKASDILESSYASIFVASNSALFGASKSIAGWEPVRTGSAGMSWETVMRK